TLNKRLAPLNIQLTKTTSESGIQARFTARGMQVSLAAVSSPLPAESFLGALESPLSRPMRGILADTLFRHNRHMIVTVSPDHAHNAGMTVDKLALLRVAHAAATLLAQWHQPAAVHWRQSNQLLTGRQYLSLADEVTPWALFAHAKIKFGGQPDQSARSHGLQLDEAVDFIGRPIIFHQTDRPLEEIHAAALSFLRHGFETGTPIPDGHTFGPAGGNMVRVWHRPPSKDLPLGRFELTAIDTPVDIMVGAPASVAVQQTSTPSVTVPADNIAARSAVAEPRDQTRSLAVSFLMLVILPPVGALLLILNLIFGANAWRTGFIASASVVFALALGVYTFLNFNTERTAILYDDPIVESAILGQ
ncbi:MAG: hypothetical protein ACU0DI_10325, partial [Paracoccaceae bacterium]